jgi:hypothetical protein
MPGKIPQTVWLYRITNRENLAHILRYGICNKNHPDANPDFVSIGNPEIIATRNDHEVKIEGYGKIGDYVPFYFSPKSIMLYNILTGYGVKKIKPEEIIFLITDIESAVNCKQLYFFSDGQANTRISQHYNDLKDLDKIDWEVVQSGDFSKSIKDNDRTRRYQAEFLIYKKVPVNCIKAIVVYNESCATFVKKKLALTGLIIQVHIKRPFYFNR